MKISEGTPSADRIKTIGRVSRIDDANFHDVPPGSAEIVVQISVIGSTFGGLFSALPCNFRVDSSTKRLIRFQQLGGLASGAEYDLTDIPNVQFIGSLLLSSQVFFCARPCTSPCEAGATRANWGDHAFYSLERVIRFFQPS